MKTLLKVIICLYLVLSIMTSVVYCNSENPWDIANARNGLLVWGYDDTGWWILSPFTNYADVFLFGWGIDDEGYTYTYSDGLDSFGQYDLSK